MDYFTWGNSFTLNKQRSKHTFYCNCTSCKACSMASCGSACKHAWLLSTPSSYACISYTCIKLVILALRLFRSYLRGCSIEESRASLWFFLRKVWVVRERLSAQEKYSFCCPLKDQYICHLNFSQDPEGFVHTATRKKNCWRTEKEVFVLSRARKGVMLELENKLRTWFQRKVILSIIYFYFFFEELKNISI